MVASGESFEGQGAEGAAVGGDAHHGGRSGGWRCRVEGVAAVREMRKRGLARGHMEVRGRFGRGGGEFDEGGTAGAPSEREARPWGLEWREPKSWGDRGGCEGDRGARARGGAH